MSDARDFLDVAGYLDFFSSPDINGSEATDFLAENADRKKYFIGKNAESLALMEHFRFDGVIDDFAAPGSCWNGVPCVPSAAVPRSSMVINCSTSISPVSVARLAEAISGGNAQSYSQLCRLLYPRLPLPEFVCQARDDLTINRAHYQALFARLGDEESQRVFNTLMRYRLTADVNTMAGFSVRMQEQYFEPFLGNLDDAVFVDCGGYDGDTTEQFCNRYPKYRRVFLFEPSQQNMTSAKLRLRDARDVDFIPLGVSDTPGILYFNPDAGSASSVSADGSAQIAVTTIDIAVDARNCFIKMDLEGWELKALQGAQGHIKNGHPILAIAVYHTVSDFWRIPEYVLSLRPDYRIYLRHYTEGWSETVMYFIPATPAPA